MYGEEDLNSHHVIKYGLTLKFFNLFQDVKYLNIELAPVLIRQFHVWVRPFVDKNLHNKKWVRRIQLETGLGSMKDVQQALSRKPKMVKLPSSKSERTTILMPIRLAYLAFSQLRKQNVIFMIRNKQDEGFLGKLLEKLKLPPNFDVFRFHRAVKRLEIESEITKNIQKQLNEILQEDIPYPEVFRLPQFKQWMITKCIAAAKTIHALDQLIVDHNIGVILETSEIVNPGTALSLIAQKYELPFINAPQVMTADHALIPTRATYHCVWGNQYKEWLLTRGIPEEKIVISGNTRFEQELMAKPMLHSKQELLQAHNVFRPFQPLVITYTTQPYDHEVQQQILQWIHEAAKLQLPLLFIIRPHPADPFDYRSNINAKNVILSSKKVPLYDLLRQTDVVMTVCSNTAFEAALFQKGIFVLQPEIPYHYTLNYNDYHKLLVYGDAGPVITSADDLKRVARRAVVSNLFLTKCINQAQACLKLSVQTEGPPSFIISQLIKNLIKTSTR